MWLCACLPEDDKVETLSSLRKGDNAKSRQNATLTRFRMCAVPHDSTKRLRGTNQLQILVRKQIHEKKLTNRLEDRHNNSQKTELKVLQIPVKKATAIFL